MPRRNATLVTAFDEEHSRPERGIVHAVAPRPAPDREHTIAAVTQLLHALGRDPGAPHLADTPRRVADALIEMLTPREFTATTFENDAGYAELVLVRDIPFTSLCEHHLLPFQGVAHIGYLPGDRIIGLSKLARVLEYFSRELQVQERLTQQVADWVYDELGARGAGVVIEAEHQCMAARGARVSGSRTTTSAWLGELRSDRAARAEFLQMSGIGAASEEGSRS